MKYLVLLFLGSFMSFFDFSLVLLFLGGSLVLLFLGGLSSESMGVFMFDMYSFVLVGLSMLVFVFCVLASISELWGGNRWISFMCYLCIMFLLLFVSFTTLSIVIFYVSFEFIFLVMFIFLLGWGYSPERFQASFYMVFYTLVVSFPFLVYLGWFGREGSLLFGCLSGWGSYWWFFILAVFMVKLPVFGVHLWLPKAHVEAPVSGSMILAGVLLKLGGYGFLRVWSSFSLFLGVSGGYLLSIGLLGGLAACFLCLRQVDFKAFVAYSSVCHMGLALAGIFSSSGLGVSGGVYMLVAHGFCSSCLFYMLYVLYDRFYSRSLLILKGCMVIFPLVSGLWFFGCIFNMGVPPSLSFFSEVFVLMSMGGFSVSSFWFCGVILLFSGVYGIYMYTSMSHGGATFGGVSHFFSLRECLVIYGHLFPLFYIVFFVSVVFWV